MHLFISKASFLSTSNKFAEVEERREEEEEEEEEDEEDEEEEEEEEEEEDSTKKSPLLAFTHKAWFLKAMEAKGNSSWQALLGCRRDTS